MFEIFGEEKKIIQSCHACIERTGEADINKCLHNFLEEYKARNYIRKQ